ncbi:hypothetical protein [Undibacterium umbellatum]|uniref:hypothetical protein n=1 Tax=Undibacterium umbellatum TaxID=2762300 RepID=UPI002E313218|nr:hypothetical protein [Undibacterium umbellatum]
MNYKPADASAKPVKLAATPAPSVDLTSQGGEVKLPHERDETAGSPGKPRKIMKQALRDLQAGMQDTDMHGERGVEAVVRLPSKNDQKP